MNRVKDVFVVTVVTFGLYGFVKSTTKAMLANWH